MFPNGISRSIKDAEEKYINDKNGNNASYVFSITIKDSNLYLTFFCLNMPFFHALNIHDKFTLQSCGLLHEPLVTLVPMNGYDQVMNDLTGK